MKTGLQSLASFLPQALTSRWARCLAARTRFTPLAALVPAAGLLWSAPAMAATLTVTSAADSGAGSLRQAIAVAAAGDTIAFAVTGNIGLSSGELVVDKDLTIQGPGASVLSLDGGHASRVLNVTTGRVHLSRLSVANGQVKGRRGRDAAGVNDPGETGGVGGGGGILNQGDLTLNECVLVGNVADGGDGGDGGEDFVLLPPGPGGRGGLGVGGAIYNRHRLTLLNSTFYTNACLGGTGGTGGLGLAFFDLRGGQGGAGGVAAGGAIYNEGIFAATNCTFFTNRAEGGAGGAGGGGDTWGGRGGVGGSGLGGALGNVSGGTIVSCTIYRNASDSAMGGPGGFGGTTDGDSGTNGTSYGGGLMYPINTVGLPSGYVRNTIVAGNSALIEPDAYGHFENGGANLVGQSNGENSFNSILGETIDPRLGPLGYYHSSTPVLPLLPDSPAIDSGNGRGTYTDQRGFLRQAWEGQVWNGFPPDDQTPGVPSDIGAYERERGVLLVVTNVQDSGPGSLRQTLLAAAAQPGTETIIFDIPGPAPHSIRLRSPLPPITSPITIDGAIPPPTGMQTWDDAAPLVVLDGAAAGAGAHGLTLRSTNCIVRGLVIQRFSNAGIYIEGNYNLVSGNYLGTDSAGRTGAPNAVGLQISNAFVNLLGGFHPAARNLISGNGAQGVLISGTNASANRVHANFIGTDVTGAGALGNGLAGVEVNSGAEFDDIITNRIAFNGKGVVIVGESQGHAISRNSIYANAGPGIDLGNDGVTANDADDTYIGPNFFLNYPVLTAVTTDGVFTYVQGSLSPTINRQRYLIEFYASAAPDPSGYGEGETFLGYYSTEGTPEGRVNFVANLQVDVPVGQFITATSIRSESTSEFSAAVVNSGRALFTAQPQGGSVLDGQITTLTVSALGAALNYQWRFNGLDIPGATNSFLYFAASTNQAGAYTVVVSTLYGAATSAVATVTVRQQAPVFALHPASQTVVEGTPVRFIASAPSGPQATYSLLFNGTNVGVPPVYFPSAVVFTLLETATNHTGGYAIVASNIVGVVTSAVAILTVTPAGLLDRWTQRNPLPQSQSLLSLAEGNGLLVAVGEMGATLTSTNGGNWAVQPRRVDVALRGIASGANRFVAVGDGGILVTSPDGTNWTARSSGGPDYFSGVAYGNGLFVALGYSPGTPGTIVLTSPDGMEWERQWLPYDDAGGGGVAFGRGTFVAAYRHVLTSANGRDWTRRTQVNCYFEAVTFGDDRFVAVGSFVPIEFSTDGISWTASNTSINERLFGVTYGDGQFVAVGSGGAVYASTTGMTWIRQNSGTLDQLETVAFAHGLFVTAGQDGTTLTSTNAAVWTPRNFVTTRDLDGMTIAHGQIVAVGLVGTILTSTDGLRYTPQASGVTEDLHGVAWGNGQWVAVGEPGVILTSPNAIGWTRRVSGTTASLKRVIYDNGRWIAVGTSGTVVTSPDGALWTPRSVGTVYDLNDVAYGNGTFVIVGDGRRGRNGSLYTSTNGVIWTDHDPHAGKNLRGITFADGIFLVTGNDGTVLVSTNGLAWAFRSSGVVYDGANLRGATWVRGLWTVVGNDGLLLTSTNTYDWTSRYSRTRDNLHGVEFLNGALVTVGKRGTILQSDRFYSSLLIVLAYDPEIGFEFTINAEPGRPYRLQATSDLIQWTDIFTFDNTQANTLFLDEEAVFHPHRFYRAVSP